MRVNLYKRNYAGKRNVWWGQWTDEREPLGSRARIKRKSTKCTDRRAAEHVAAGWEREAADPAYAAANKATIETAAQQFLSELPRRDLAPGTIEMYVRKVGHVVRVLGRGMRLADVDARAVDAAIETWTDEGAAQHEMHKRLIAFRGILRSAKRRGEFVGDPRGVMPICFGTGYVPRTRNLSIGELRRLVLAIVTRSSPGRAAQVLFAVATGARLGELVKARRSDVGARGVRLRGTKTAGADRTVPIVPMFAEMLSAAVEHADGEEDYLFLPWTNSRRAMLLACELAQIPPCSWNDLRRTFASMLIQAGAENAHTARALGHSTSVMVDRVYGRHSATSLGDLLAASTAGATALPGVH